MGVIFVAGVTAIAVSNFGTQSNPLATKSYVDNVASENILSSLTSAVSTKASELETKFNKQIEAFEAGEITGTPSSFEVITLSTNQVIRCGVGTEIIVRSARQPATETGRTIFWTLRRNYSHSRRGRYDKQPHVRCFNI